MVNKKWFMQKPVRNWRGIVPKPLSSSRAVRVDLLPRTQRLVAGGVIPKPLWLDAMLAHPPPVEHKYTGERPVRFQWREEDRLRRTWQRRNPAASMHPKVLFVDESRLPAGSALEHPADIFVRKQMALMRKGLSEEEAYRRVLNEEEEASRPSRGEVSDAHASARALGATPAQPETSREGFAERLLRRFAEEARDGKQPYPEHWFNEDGTWRGIGMATQLQGSTRRALERAANRPGVLARQILEEMPEDAPDNASDTGAGRVPDTVDAVDGATDGTPSADGTAGAKGAAPSDSERS
jgi:hypothetical protein